MTENIKRYVALETAPRNIEALEDALIYLREVIHLFVDIALDHMPMYGDPENIHDGDAEEVSEMLDAVKAALDDRLTRLDLLKRDDSKRVTHKRATYSTGIEVWTTHPDKAVVLNTPEKYTPHIMRGGAA